MIALLFKLCIGQFTTWRRDLEQDLWAIGTRHPRVYDIYKTGGDGPPVKERNPNEDQDWR